MLKCLLSTTTSEKSQSDQPKCTCRKLNMTPSTSNSSLTIEYVPVKVTLETKKMNWSRHKNKTKTQPNQSQNKAQRLQKSPLKKINISHKELPKEQFAQTDTAKTHFAYQPQEAWQLLEAMQCHQKLQNFYGHPPNVYSLPINHVDKFKNTVYEEQFYSCSSENSENEESSKKPKNAKHQAILELLQEVENLIKKDNVAQKEIKEESSIGLSECITQTTAEESEEEPKFKDKISKPTSTTQINSMFYPAQPFFCNCPTHMPPFNSPFFVPFNVVNIASDQIQVPSTFVHEESVGFKDCSSGNKSIATADYLADNSTCAYPSVQSPLEYNIESLFPLNSVIENIKTDVSIQADVNSFLEELSGKKEIATQFDGLENQVNDEESVIFKDCSSGNNSILTTDFASQYACKLGFLEEECRPTTLSCIPLIGSKITDLFTQSIIDPFMLINTLGYKSKTDVSPKSLEMEEYVDEELHPPYVDKIFTEPFDLYEPSPDCLMEYDDEEPILSKFDYEIEFAKLEDLTASEMYQPCLDCLTDYDDEDPDYEDKTRKEQIQQEIKEVENISQLEFVETEMLPETRELDEIEAVLIEPADLIEQVETKETEEYLLDPTYIEEAKEEPEALPSNEDITIVESPDSEEFVVPIEVFDSDIDKTEDLRQIIAYENDESEEEYHEEDNEYLGEEEEYELAKEKLAESRKRTKHFEKDPLVDIERALVAQKQMEGGSSCPEMKFFVDSLILDLEAMDYARRRSQFEKNIYKPKKVDLCARDSFPVTITDVMDLGANSLYVKWKIHDCFGIGGYEIYTDNYLTNRYYHSRHNSAVITQVDITVPHKIALVAQPSSGDESIISFCCKNQNRNKLKSIPWRTDEEKLRKTYPVLWTPSIFLYDPVPDRAAIYPTIIK